MDKKLAVNIITNVAMIGGAFAAGVCVTTFKTRKDLTKHFDMQKARDFIQAYDNLVVLNYLVKKNEDCKNESEES